MDDNVRRHQSLQKKSQRVYQQLGATSLIYRHKPSYESRLTVAPASSWNMRSEVLPNVIHETLNRSNRVRSRWNFPIDQSFVENVKVDPKDCVNKKAKLSENESKTDYIYDQENTSQRDLPILQTGRLAMLMKDNGETDHIFEMLEDYINYDHPYILGHFEETIKGFTPTLNPQCFKDSFVFRQDRRNCADPSYLAPFSLSSIDATIGTNESDEFNDSKSLGLQHGNCLVCLPCPCPPCYSGDQSQCSWCLFHPIGDLLERICVSNLILPHGQKNVGHLRDREAHEISRRPKRKNERDMEELRNELDLGSTIMEVKQCGIWRPDIGCGTFVVRTVTHISVLKVTVEKSSFRAGDGNDNNLCWGNYRVKENNRIDLRSLSRCIPSYLPVSISCHPRYGNMLTTAKLAIVSHSNQNDLNVIHHVMAGTPETISKHTISSLKRISLIDFTSSNPMCLWSAAKSYVSPTLVPDAVNEQPAFGLGASLFNIDLRCNSASFQWSPSAEEFATEGVHSISGIMTDWQKEQTVWVSSISAGKTWEIDSRMPCEAVNVWSLPFTCDDCGGDTFPSCGLDGHGTLLVQPLVSNFAKERHNGGGDLSAPVLSVEKTPGSFGIHLYQRPRNPPRLQTQSLECIATPGLSFTDKTSVATSAAFPLPDVADHAFTCGLTTLSAPISQFLNNKQKIQLGYMEGQVDDEDHILCAITLTNKGDIYSHALLESKNEKPSLRAKLQKSQPFINLPLGSSAIAIPADGASFKSKGMGKGVLIKKPLGGLNLSMHLSNEFPTPGSMVASPMPKEPFNKRQLKVQAVKKEPHRKSSKALNSDGPEAVYKFPKKGTLAVRAAGKQQKGISHHDESLVLPLKLAQSAHEKLSSFSRRFKDNKNVDCGKQEQDVTSKSDVSLQMINESMKIWDELDDGPPSEIDSDASAYI